METPQAHCAEEAPYRPAESECLPRKSTPLFNRSIFSNSKATFFKISI
jgi:hypothetical protein